jgi:UDP-N-acetylmuramoyl-tripeptide--D-alanyl-D-alanine ligase
MLDRLRGLLRMTRTALGRRKLRGKIGFAFWPILRHLASLHRATLARRVRVVAVVGSFGKTTTTAAVTAALGLPVPTRGANAFDRLARRVLAVRPWQDIAVFEVGIDRPGQMALYGAMLRPDIVVVTAIGSEHNRALGPLEATQFEKSRMVAALRPGGTAVLNADDPMVMAMASLAPGRRVVTFGFAHGATVRAAEHRTAWPGAHLIVDAGGERQALHVQLPGRVMAYPILAASAVAHVCGRQLVEAAPALEELEARPGRLRPVRLANGAWLLDDSHKSAVETVDAALDVLKDAPGRRIVVIGSVSDPPGSQGEVYRHLGERLAQAADRVIVVGTAYKQYAAAARRAGMPAAALTRARNGVIEAARLVEAELGPGDVVLIKGRNDQKLQRVALALAGRTVTCAVESCRIPGLNCKDCPMLDAAVPLHGAAPA